MFNTITSIALLLISGGVVFTYITPKYHEIIDLRAQSGELDSALLKAKDVENISKELSEKMRSFRKEDIDRLERLLPEKFDDLRFAYDIQGVAQRNGLKVQGITIDDKPVEGGAPSSTQSAPSGPGTGVSERPRGSNGYVAHKLSFSVSAPYGTFTTFLKDLERSLQFIDITSISLLQGGGGPTPQTGGRQASQDNYSYTVEFNTYSLK